MQQQVTRIGSLLMLSLFLAIPALAAPCPPDSVQVGATCVDTYEASVWQIPDVLKNRALLNKVRCGRADLGDLQAGASTTGGPGAIARGELFTGGTLAGVFAISALGGPADADPATGFCCGR